jgi:hypothetical protein
MGMFENGPLHKEQRGIDEENDSKSDAHFK